MTLDSRQNNSSNLRPHRLVFALHYLACGDGVEAARRTGYTRPKSASYHLFKRRDVKATIRAFRAHNVHDLIKGAVAAIQREKSKRFVSLCGYLDVNPNGTVRLKKPDELEPHELDGLSDWSLDDEGRMVSIQIREYSDALWETARLVDSNPEPETVPEEEQEQIRALELRREAY